MLLPLLSELDNDTFGQTVEPQSPAQILARWYAQRDRYVAWAVKNGQFSKKEAEDSRDHHDFAAALLERFLPLLPTPAFKAA